MIKIIAFLALLSNFATAAQHPNDLIPALFAISESLRGFPDYNASSPFWWNFTNGAVNAQGQDPVVALSNVASEISGLESQPIESNHSTYLNLSQSYMDVDWAYYQYICDLPIYISGVAGSVLYVQNTTVNRSEICDFVGACEQVMNATSRLNVTLASRGLINAGSVSDTNGVLNQVQQYEHDAMSVAGNCSNDQNRSDPYYVDHVSSATPASVMTMSLTG